jgi:hypothetical protein
MKVCQRCVGPYWSKPLKISANSKQACKYRDIILFHQYRLSLPACPRSTNRMRIGMARVSDRLWVLHHEVDPILVHLMWFLTGGICVQLAFRTNSDKSFTWGGTRVCWMGGRNEFHSAAIRVGMILKITYSQNNWFIVSCKCDTFIPGSKSVVFDCTLSWVLSKTQRHDSN